MKFQSDLCSNELRKVGLLLQKANDLGLDLDCYGEIGLNKSNGNVYLWSENYHFSLFIDLGSDTIWACWTNYDDGEEEIIDATNESLYTLDDWVRENEYKVGHYCHSSL
jgi:hypothetical protein